MSRYLVVAHQTAATPGLLSKLRQLAGEDSNAKFVLLVPATPIPHLLTWVEGEAVEVARRAAELAAEQMEKFGIAVRRTEVGDGSPLVAIEDELREHPGAYDAIVLSTLPLGVSRWLKLDLPHQVKRKFGLPVVHVVSEVERAEVESGS